MDKMFLAQGHGRCQLLAGIDSNGRIDRFLSNEGLRVKPQWRLSLLVAGLVTLVAGVITTTCVTSGL